MKEKSDKSDKSDKSKSTWNLRKFMMDYLYNVKPGHLDFASLIMWCLIGVVHKRCQRFLEVFRWIEECGNMGEKGVKKVRWSLMHNQTDEE